MYSRCQTLRTLNRKKEVVIQSERRRRSILYTFCPNGNFSHGKFGSLSPRKASFSLETKSDLGHVCLLDDVDALPVPCFFIKVQNLATHLLLELWVLAAQNLSGGIFVTEQRWWWNIKVTCQSFKQRSMSTRLSQ